MSKSTSHFQRQNLLIFLVKFCIWSLFICSGFAKYLSLDGKMSSSDADALHITFSCFSGRPDPQWDIPPSHKNYSQIINSLNGAKSSNLLQQPSQIASKLGYRGILVFKNGTGYLVVGQKTVQLQKMLLYSAPETLLSSGVKDRFSSLIDHAQ